jgi:hypothetical protein
MREILVLPDRIRPGDRAAASEVVAGWATVEDGDTLTVGRTEVRLFGIDALEMRSGHGHFARRARGSHLRAGGPVQGARPRSLQTLGGGPSHRPRAGPRRRATAGSPRGRFHRNPRYPGRERPIAEIAAIIPKLPPISRNSLCAGAKARRR